LERFHLGVQNNGTKWKLFDALILDAGRVFEKEGPKGSF